MVEKSELFRQQALSYRAARPEGCAVIQQTALLSSLVYLSGLFILGALSVLLFMQYKETVPARGILEPVHPAQKINSPVNATVHEITVTPGDRVESGQVLARLSARTFDANGMPATLANISQLEARRSSVARERGLLIDKNEKSADRYLAAGVNHQHSLILIDEELGVLEQQLQLSQENLSAIQSLLNSANIPQSQYNREQAQHLQLLRQKQIVLQNRQRVQLQLQLSNAEKQSAAVDFALTDLRLENQLAQLDHDIEQLNVLELTSLVADSPGIVASVSSREGSPVRAGQPLIFISPIETDLQARIYVPSRVVGKLAPGQSLLLSYDAFDHSHYGRYEATIQSIGQASLDPREHLLPVPGINEPVFEIIAVPSQEYVEGPDVYRLQSGIMLTADFVHQEMALLDFIMRPILELRGKIF